MNDTIDSLGKLFITAIVIGWLMYMSVIIINNASYTKQIRDYLVGDTNVKD